MGVARLGIAESRPERTIPDMDRPIKHPAWSPLSWRPGAKVAVVLGVFVAATLVGARFIAGTGGRTLRIPAEQVSIAKVESAIFHDLIPLHTTVVPRETVYVDAVDGGRVDRLLVEAGDMVEEGQPMIEISNTNLALQVIQQESQLNQAISQLQQNEISLEQSDLSNARALAEINYHVLRLERAASRRASLADKGAIPAEQRDAIADELAYYIGLRPIQAESGQRQSALRERLLPDIHYQLKNLRSNLSVVHDRLDSLVIRAPVSGRVTSLDLQVGENRGPGERFAEVTPDAGMKLVADVDQFYLARVRIGQTATININGNPVEVSVRRVLPQVRNGSFRIDMDLDVSSPAALVAGASAEGRLRLGEDTPAVVIPNGPFLERTAGAWIFVVAPDGRSAERRQIQIGRRTTEQIEVLSGLSVGDRAITSDYAGLDRVDRISLTN